MGDMENLINYIVKQTEHEPFPLKHYWHLVDASITAHKHYMFINQLMEKISEVGGIYKCSCGIDMTADI